MFGRSVGTRMLLLVAVVLLHAQASSAQSTTVTFTPSSPSGVITARITFQGLACAYVPTTVVNGSTIQMTIAISSCFTGPPASTITEFVPFGPLPAGTYNYELYFQYENDPPALRVQQPLVIAAASIPMLDSLPLVLLGVALLASGLLVLRRG